MDIRRPCGAAVFLFCLGCGGETVGPDVEEVPTPASTLVDGWAVTSGPTGELLAAHSTAGRVLIEPSTSNGVLLGTPTIRLVLDRTSGADATVWIDADGRPTQAVFGSLLVLFSNWTATEVDVALITSAGASTIRRAVQFSGDGHFMETRIGAVPSAAFGSSERTLLKIGATALNVASCAASIVAAGGTFGAGAVLAGVVCGSAAYSIWNRWTAADDARLQASAMGMGLAIGAVTCAAGANVSACVSLILTSSAAALNIATSVALDLQDEARAAQGALGSRAGALQVTLTWNNTADLDLSALEPDGTIINYISRRSTSGGELDVDDTDGFGPENIAWPSGHVPTGEIRVRVHHYAGPAPATWTILIQRGTESRTVTGQLLAGATSSVILINSASPLG